MSFDQRHLLIKGSKQIDERQGEIHTASDTFPDGCNPPVQPSGVSYRPECSPAAASEMKHDRDAEFWSVKHTVLYSTGHACMHLPSTIWICRDAGCKGSNGSMGSMSRRHCNLTLTNSLPSAFSPLFCFFDSSNTFDREEEARERVLEP